FLNSVWPQFCQNLRQYLVLNIGYSLMIDIFNCDHLIAGSFLRDFIIFNNPRDRQRDCLVVESYTKETRKTPRGRTCQLADKIIDHGYSKITSVVFLDGMS